MGLRDLFSEIAGRADDAMSGRNRLHRRSLNFLNDQNNLQTAEVVVPTSGLEFDLVKFAIGAELDRVFARVPSVEPQYGWEAHYGASHTWASSWFMDATWSAHHAIGYAMYPSVNGEWWHPNSPLMKMYSTTTGWHPFFFLYFIAKPMPPHTVRAFEHMLVVAAALDMHRGGPEVVWIAHPEILLGAGGLALKALTSLREHKDEGRGDRFFYYDGSDRDPFARWPHRVLVEPPPNGA